MMSQVMIKIVSQKGESMYRFSVAPEQEFYTIRHISGADVGELIGQFESHFDMDEVINILQGMDGIESAAKI